MSMRVLFLTINNRLHASSRVRAYQYEPYLKEVGIRSHFIPNVSETYYRLRRLSPNPKIRNSPFVLGWGRMERLLRLLWFCVAALSGSYDIVFVQKFLLPIPLLRLFDALHRPIVFDFDDAIYLLSQQPFTTVAGFEYTMKVSRAVIVTTDELRKVAQQFNSNVVRIPGPIDTERYQPQELGLRRNSEEIVIGWIGGSSTISYVEILFDVFRRLTAKYPHLVISVVGSWPFKVEGVNLRVKQWSLDSEIEDLSRFDIGIMPMPDNDWTRGKGGYKLLQYMAMRIPCVASPVGINTEIIRDGVNGFTAQSLTDWYDKLSILIEDVELRQQMGREGRSISEQDYSIRANVPKLINLFRSIVG